MIQPPLDPSWAPTLRTGSSVHALESKPHFDPDAESERTREDLALEETFRHSGWRRIREAVLGALYRVEPSIWRINAFKSCGSDAWVDRSEDEPNVYRIRCDRCHDRFCIPCGRERARVIAYQVGQRLHTQNARFITLTLRSSDEPLAALLDHLYTSFTKLRRTKLWQATQRGGVAFLEVKWSPDKSRWHPHLHVLVEGKFIAQKALANAWNKATGNSFIVHVTKVRTAERVTAYVVKYASKPHDPSIFFDPARLEEAILAMKGRKLCLTFGTWRGHCLTRMPPSGTWTPVAPLSDLLRQARDGDPEAREICTRLSGSPPAGEDFAPPDENELDDIPF